MGEKDLRVEEYFSVQFGLDKNILIGMMLQFKNSKKNCFGGILMITREEL